MIVYLVIPHVGQLRQTHIADRKPGYGTAALEGHHQFVLVSLQTYTDPDSYNQHTDILGRDEVGQ